MYSHSIYVNVKLMCELYNGAVIENISDVFNSKQTTPLANQDKK